MFELASQPNDCHFVWLYLYVLRKICEYSYLYVSGLSISAVSKFFLSMINALYFPFFRDYSTFWIHILDDKKIRPLMFCVVYLQILHQLSCKAESRFKSARLHFIIKTKTSTSKKQKKSTKKWRPVLLFHV